MENVSPISIYETRLLLLLGSHSFFKSKYILSRGTRQLIGLDVLSRGNKNIFSSLEQTRKS